MTEFLVDFDRSSQSIGALREAAYRIMRDASCQIEIAGDRYFCRLTPKQGRSTTEVGGEQLRGNFLDLVTDDVTWTCPGPTEILPYAQVYKGKEGVAEFFRLIYDNKDFPGFEVTELIGEGDKVVALGHWDAKSKKTGNAYSGDWAMAFWYRDGKLYEHKEYYDSYGEAMASRP